MSENDKNGMAYTCENEMERENERAEVCEDTDQKHKILGTG